LGKTHGPQDLSVVFVRFSDNRGVKLILIHKFLSFKVDTRDNNFKVGMKLEACVRKKTDLVRPATIVQVRETKVKVK